MAPNCGYLRVLAELVGSCCTISVRTAHWVHRLSPKGAHQCTCVYVRITAHMSMCEYLLLCSCAHNCRYVHLCLTVSTVTVVVGMFLDSMVRESALKWRGICHDGHFTS
eukprot:GHVS01092610.1.p1 GENE.GHVS01092610.1~~GHVS01092610.1.p1  ORF type:complete len:109 (-),score=2.15 GHVS01092610.1:129-455(-)